MRIYLIAILSLLISTGAWAKERHPTVETERNCCLFTYTLRKPVVAPSKPVPQTFRIMVPYGETAQGMPYTKRAESITNCKEARVEAEARADMIENVNRPKAPSTDPKATGWLFAYDIEVHKKSQKLTLWVPNCASRKEQGCANDQATAKTYADKLSKKAEIDLSK